MTDKENELTNIISEYTANLPEKIDSIQESWNQLVKAWDPLVLKDLHNRIHGLHGSAGMFGYQALSETAGKLELIIDEGFTKEFSEEQKNKITELLNEIKLKSKSHKDNANLTIPQAAVTKNTNDNKIFILNIGSQSLNTNFNWVDEMGKKLAIFDYQMKHITTFERLEDELKKEQPFALLINLNLLSDENEKKFSEMKDKYFPKTPLLFFANSGDFSLRIKAVKMHGKAYLVLPFLIDDLIYEFDRIRKLESDSYRAIIIDDEVEVANYQAAILTKANFNCKIVTKVDELDKALHDFKPDVMLMDYYMPECTGYELASLIRQQREYEFTPIIFLSSEEDRVKQLNAMKIGVDDFLTKKTPPDYLIIAVKNKAYRYKVLQSMTTKDNLTVALNERATLKKIESILTEAQPVSETVVVAIIKINNLEKINNEFGNQSGDQVQKGLSLMLRARTRVFDVIGIYKSKFLLIMPHTDLQTAKSLIKELQSQFMMLTYYHKNQIFNCTFTAGLASTESGYDYKALLQEAEQGLVKNPVKAL